MPLVARRLRIRHLAFTCLVAIIVLGVAAYFLHDTRRRAPLEPFFEGLGNHSRKITTVSPTAQRYFDQGLAFLYGFNYTEAARSFAAAADCDPNCAMAYWGVAIANGDAVNDPATDEPLAKAAVEAVAKAQDLSAGATPVERDLVDALSHRYADPPPADPKPLDRAYAAAMRKVWQSYPDDGDVGALTGQALMLLHRKGYWTQEGEAQPGTEEAINTLNAVLARHPRHPYALHLLIHVLEASPHPEKADQAADLLRDMAPGLGHFTHMPTHIDIRRGRWQEAVVASEKAIRADQTYRQLAGNPGLYCRMLMAHDNHMLAYAAAMQGQSQKATQAISDLLTDLPADFVTAHSAKVDAFFAMPYELHIRFGQWQQMLAEKEPPKGNFPITRAFWHFARGTAFAALNRPAEAEIEQADFKATAQKIPPTAVFLKNPAAAVFDVADNMLAGEILYREGKIDDAIAHLTFAVNYDDALQYVEPPEWILPPRHALGATLLDAHRYAEAEAVYHTDLARRPDNGWSLFGLSRALKMQKKTHEAAAVDAQLKQVWQHADIKLTGSCLCLPSKD